MAKLPPIGHWSDALLELNACEEAVLWARDYATFEAAWATCKRGDWMLWRAGRVAGPPWSESRRPLVRAASACVRLALPVWEARYPEDRMLRYCLDLADQWAHGEDVQQDDLLAANTSPHAANVVAAAATYACYVAQVADAVAHAVYVAVDAADYALRKVVLAQCADLVRQVYPTPPERTEPC